MVPYMLREVFELGAPLLAGDAATSHRPSKIERVNIKIDE